MQKEKKYFFRRHPRLSLGLFSGILLLLGLVLFEAGLRWLGYVPGQRGLEVPAWKGDSICYRDDYLTDADGIIHVSPWKREQIGDFLRENSYYPVEDLELDYSLESMAHSFDLLGTGELEDEEFRAFADSIRQIPDEEQDSFARAVHHYLRNPINSEGFRSIPFGQAISERPKVLLLGDSFCWGLSCEPLTNSFADRLLARGYAVYNTGIIGTDPAQYLAIAQKFIPQIKPDLVIVNFFMGNDIFNCRRVAQQGKEFKHFTNIGWLAGFTEGVYITAEECYELNQRHFFIPQGVGQDFDRFCAKTVLGTRLWYAIGRENQNLSNYRTGLPFYENPQSEYFMNEIKAVCEASGARMEVAVIPWYKEMPGTSGVFEHKLSRNFPEFPVSVPETLEKDDYRENDDHFNSAGMKKWADFLESIIQKPSHEG